MGPTIGGDDMRMHIEIYIVMHVGTVWGSLLRNKCKCWREDGACPG